MLSVALLVATLAAVAAALAQRSPRATAAWLAAATVAGGAFLAVTETYQVRKLVGTTAMPTGLVWLALLAAAALAVRRAPAWLAASLWVVWLAYTAAGNVWLGDALVTRLEAPYTTTDPFTVAPCDAIVVLGGGIGATAAHQITLGSAGDRLVLAARLALAGRTELLVTTGPPLASTGGALTVPGISAALWRELGVPAERIVLVEGPRTTGEEIARVAELAAARDWRRLGLISSGYHLRRALALCRRHRLEVVPFAAELATPDPRPLPRQLVPQADGFTSVQRACWELLGAAVGQERPTPSGAR